MLSSINITGLYDKAQALLLVSGCLFLLLPLQAQPDGRRGPGIGVPGNSAGPSMPGPNAGSAGPGFGALSSRGSSSIGPPHSFNPQMTGPRGSMAGQGPIQTTRFGPLDSPQEAIRRQGSSPGPSFNRNPSSGAPTDRSSYSGPSPADTSRMQQALNQRNYNLIGEESRGVRSRADNIQNLGPDLPVQERLKLPLINRMYRQGADLVDDGRTKQDPSKIKMGIQQINEANDKLGRIEGARGSMGEQGRHERGSIR